jgi:hypothetical protein
MAPYPMKRLKGIAIVFNTSDLTVLNRSKVWVKAYPINLLPPELALSSFAISSSVAITLFRGNFVSF